MERLWLALLHSINGLIAAWQGEPAFRQEVILAAFAVPLALLFAPDAVSMALMIGSVLIVLVVELINTAVESAIDRIGLHRDALAKKAKDAGSAAVLVSLINAAIVWAIVLI